MTETGGYPPPGDVETGSNPVASPANGLGCDEAVGDIPTEPVLEFLDIPVEFRPRLQALDVRAFLVEGDAQGGISEGSLRSLGFSGLHASVIMRRIEEKRPKLLAALYEHMHRGDAIRQDLLPAEVYQERRQAAIRGGSDAAHGVHTDAGVSCARRNEDLQSSEAANAGNATGNNRRKWAPVTTSGDNNIGAPNDKNPRVVVRSLGGWGMIYQVNDKQMDRTKCSLPPDRIFTGTTPAARIRRARPQTDRNADPTAAPADEPVVDGKMPAQSDGHVAGPEVALNTNTKKGPSMQPKPSQSLDYDALEALLRSVASASPVQSSSGASSETDSHDGERGSPSNLKERAIISTEPPTQVQGQQEGGTGEGLGRGLCVKLNDSQVVEDEADTAGSADSMVSWDEAQNGPGEEQAFLAECITVEHDYGNCLWFSPTYYTVTVRRPCGGIMVRKRYSDFVRLYSEFEAEGQRVLALQPLPPKNFWSRWSLETLELRKQGLRACLRSIVEGNFGKSHVFLRFLELAA